MAFFAAFCFLLSTTAALQVSERRAECDVIEQSRNLDFEAVLKL
jgi:hypothetical protein